MKANRPLSIVFNATSLRPGGGLTVLLGILQGLLNQPDLQVNAHVICCATETADAVRQQGFAQVRLECEHASTAKRQVWVNTRLCKIVNQQQPDLFFSINALVPGIRFPQLVYHLNLLRFLPVDRSRGWKHAVAEWLRNRAAKQALLHADANVFESQYLQSKAQQVAQPRKRSEVIYIGLPDQLIDVKLQSMAGHDQGSNDRRHPAPTLISITNHNPHKDNRTLIRTLHALVKREPQIDWQLKIAGSLFPEQWRPVKELASQLGVADRIQWLGFLTQEELTNHLVSALCLVSTSRIESFCMVALESMARGCPAIVADASSMPESVGDAARLVPPGDHDGFADAVIDLYRDQPLRTSLIARGFDRIDKFRWDRCGQEFAQLILEVTADWTPHKS